mmetsp:Transcript_31693/g.68435  ORF Transcript_31693/g.68435 Transcript_31693/m.68435 type:complete len:250 (+) Transcript_31693:224-973(+)
MSSLNVFASGTIAHEGISCVPSTISSNTTFLFASASTVFFVFVFFLRLSSMMNCPPLKVFTTCIPFTSLTPTEFVPTPLAPCIDGILMPLFRIPSGRTWPPFAIAIATSTRYSVAFFTALSSSTSLSELIHIAPAPDATIRIMASLLTAINDPLDTDSFPCVIALASRHRDSMYESALAPTPLYTILTPRPVSCLLTSRSVMVTCSAPLGPSPRGPFVFRPNPSKTHSILHPLILCSSSKSLNSNSLAC